MRKEKFFTLCAEVNVVPPNPASLRFHLRHDFKIVKKSHLHEEGYVVDFLVKSLGKPAQKQQ
jgi:predicted GNAT superfamily acetyltransferase